MKGFILLIVLLASCKIVIGQQPETGTATKPVGPLPVEIFPESRGLYYQMIINKRLTSESRFGLYNITAFRGDYHNNPSKNEFYCLATLTARIWNGISIIGGGTMVSATGFRPTIGSQYSYIKKKIVLILIARVDLAETHNIETLGLLELNPKQKKNWGPYMRVQALFNYDTQMDFHARSAAYFRLGLAYKNFQFGFGTNVDFYGPRKINENSYGGFLSAYLF
jgi:hypothetical protein